MIFPRNGFRISFATLASGVDDLKGTERWSGTGVAGSFATSILAGAALH